MKRNKPLKRGGFIKRKKAMNRISPRRREERIEYAKKGEAFLNRPENMYCPVCIAGLVSDEYATGSHLRRTTQVHHAWLRGIYYLDETTYLGVSDIGHAWICANGKEARRRGWLCITEEEKQRWRETRNITNHVQTENSACAQ